jgi:hypothetical protein
MNWRQINIIPTRVDVKLMNELAILTLLILNFIKTLQVGIFFNYFSFVAVYIFPTRYFAGTTTAVLIPRLAPCR